MKNKIDFSFIREASRNELIKLLSSIPGPKAIVWDKQLVGTFGLIGDFTFLRNYEVVKMFYISRENLPSNNIPNIIFLTVPTRNHMDYINNQLRMEEVHSGGNKKDFYLWCVPRVSLLCEERLKQHGVYGAFMSIQELPIYMYKLENDVAMLNLSSCFRDLHMNKDSSDLFFIARALMNIQGIFGLIPNVYGKGSAAKGVFDLMVGMRRELGGNEPQLILIDRAVDLITPLATQLTYEGLIDQFFGINNCTVKLPSEKFTSMNSRGGSDSPPNDSSSFDFNEMKSIPLTSADTLFADIRDFNFSAVGPRLSSEAREVSSQYEKRHTANTVSDLKQFVQKLPKMQVARQSLSTQTTIAELVQDKIINSDFRPTLHAEQELLKGSETDKVNSFIEECIYQKEPLIKVLRLICLQSIINCGLKQRVFEFYKREIINTYGFEHMLTLENLEKAGLFTVQQGKSTYATIRKTLRLTVDDVNESKPTDVSYVHSGYAPLSVRLVEFLQWPGWRAITDVLTVLPGPTISETQQLPPALKQRRGPEYVILTTKIINGNSFIESLMENLEPLS
ncbi:Vacuolar protein sorting-associated protein 33A [Armadillidium nasatum]|uniref:Vacuolar protein sorting-associated protein 33A n=1 Tax=Armadillidium nasatum TaxID=96803 RepID=A0A5N5SXC8_9CRUS|nr:Vacuolar protein sorting-associated protein 33A [Armadillidium nasatum]